MKNNLWIVYLASFIVVCGGVKLANSVIMPFLMALFIAIVINPFINQLQNKLKLPRILAFSIVIAVIFFLLGFVINTTLNTLNGLLSYMPELSSKLNALSMQILGKLSEYGIENISIPSELEPNKILSASVEFLKNGGAIVSKSFFVFLLVTFMLFQTQIFIEKIKYFAATNPKTEPLIKSFISNLKSYLVIKTLASLATGVFIFIGLSILGVKYAPLWGILAFVLNFIPTIGSIIAAIPALLVSLALNDFMITIWVLALYLAVNISIGNFIEPKFLSKGLGLSVLVVLLSLLFWGFLLGVGGMFLAVPLTMSIKIALLANQNTKFIAVLLSDKIDE
ncbi:AI-2E family transporter [Campylobacter mucosalis]|uniref:AI-2E family transporter n=1 Tax=Campylobacter mucosalis TaxID=202 RepID=UPI00147044BC|nr:AI-2E family transporter [Campylobacter mucosalis]